MRMEAITVSWKARESYLKGYAQWRMNREQELLEIKKELREQRMFLEMLAHHLFRDESS